MELAEKQEEGYFYHSLNAILLSAFSIEAYLNHIGARKIDYWETIEMKLSPKEKLVILCHHLGYEPDFSRKPFQSWIPIFKFRNSMAHGKTITVSRESTQKLSPNEYPEPARPEWEEMCTVEQARVFVSDAEKIILEIHSVAEPGNFPFGGLGSGTYRTDVTG